MPRIRKKTSKRGTSHQRARIKHKVAESRKKAKKAARKDAHPQWKSKKPKDPGIPNSFPYKAQILAEIAEQRRQEEEDRRQRKEQKKRAEKAAKSNADAEAEAEAEAGTKAETEVHAQDEGEGDAENTSTVKADDTHADDASVDEKSERRRRRGTKLSVELKRKRGQNVNKIT